MNVVVFILSVIATAGLTMVGTAVLVFTVPSDTGILLGVAASGFIVMSVTPAILGSFAAYWDLRADSQSRRYVTRLLVTIGGLNLLAVASIVGYSVVESVAVWVPIALIGVPLALAAVAMPIDRAVFRWEQPHQPFAPAWIPVPARVIQRKILIVAGVLVVTMLVSTLFSLPVSRKLPGLLLLAASFSLMVAAVTCLIVALPLNNSMREITRRDLTPTVTRAIFARKPVELSGDAPQIAVRVATMLAVTSPFQLGYGVLSVSGLSLQWVRGVALNEGGEFARIALSVLVPLMFFSVGLLGLRIRRVRRYVRDHDELLQDVETPSVDPALPLNN
ncbi:MAG: hypothetical protein H7248_05785 [Microbacteriaceae bacterium]|nr:hypothetical protein [Microbacteriaceae bacterium]